MAHSQERTVNNFPVGNSSNSHNQKHIVLINENPETVLQLG